MYLVGVVSNHFIICILQTININIYIYKEYIENLSCFFFIFFINFVTSRLALSKLGVI